MRPCLLSLLFVVVFFELLLLLFVFLLLLRLFFLFLLLLSSCDLALVGSFSFLVLCVCVCVCLFLSLCACRLFSGGCCLGCHVLLCVCVCFVVLFCWFACLLACSLPALPHLSFLVLERHCHGTCVLIEIWTVSWGFPESSELVGSRAQSCSGYVTLMQYVMGCCVNEQL